MKNVMGIVNDVQEEEVLKDLTNHRSLASVPFGCRYRLIDFPLSNMVNSGIINVGIFLENKFRSLLDHIGPGKAWDLDRKRDGLFILPPAQSYKNNRFYRGDIDSLQTNLDYLHRSSQEYVLIVSSNIICNMTFNEAFEYHLESGADITTIYKQISNPEQSKNQTVIETNKDDRVVDMKVSPERKTYNKIALEKFIMKKELLIDIIDDCYSKGLWDFIKDGIIKNLDKYEIKAYPFKGYMANINSLSSYFVNSLELLDYDIRNDAFFKNQIYTKPKDEAPTKFSNHGQTKNIIAANGCIVEGNVENSILFRGVTIKKGAEVKNSIIMQKSTVDRDAKLNNVIMDKNARIKQGGEFKGSENFPVVIEKNAVV
ncbi:MAG: glucose-1-phosphate adenylyltransferase subunit GlgD [Halanaerobiales bacterium]